MNKVVKNILTVFLFTLVSLFVTTYPVSATEKKIVYSDIVVYINHWAIPSFHCDGNTYIRVTDLSGYGFDVIKDIYTNAIIISRNTNTQPSPIEAYKASGELLGQELSVLSVSKNRVFLVGNVKNGYSLSTDVINKALTTQQILDNSSIYSLMQIPSYEDSNGNILIDVETLKHLSYKVEWFSDIRIIKIWGEYPKLRNEMQDVSLITDASQIPIINTVNQTSEIDSPDLLLSEEIQNNNDEDFTVTELKELTSAEIYAKCSDAVFMIKAYDLIGNLVSTGSGFFITSKGVAITNFHVISDASFITIITTDGTVYTDIFVLGYDIEKDLIALGVLGADVAFLETTNSASINGGDRVYALGSPLGLTNTITDGIISNPHRDVLGHDMIQISAAVSPGSSGGALINTYGQVVGIITSKRIDGDSIGFAIPLSRVAEMRNNEGYTLSEVTRIYKANSIQVVPNIYERIVYETEDNNTHPNENLIENGDTVFGVLDAGDDLDAFKMNVQTKGTIFVYLGGALGNTAGQEMVLRDNKNIIANSEYHTAPDGSTALLIISEITEPGTYYLIAVDMEKEKRKEYEFYYYFVPHE